MTWRFLVKALILILALIPMVALAQLDDAVFDGASCATSNDTFTDEPSVYNGTTEKEKETRGPAAVEEEFTFQADGYDTGSSVN